MFFCRVLGREGVCLEDERVEAFPTDAEFDAVLPWDVSWLHKRIF